MYHRSIIKVSEMHLKESEMHQKRIRNASEMHQKSKTKV